MEKITATEQKPSRELRLGKVFWGLLLMVVGSLFLLRNFEVVSIDIANIWRLWPLFLIAAGISMLSLRGLFGAIVLTTLAISILIFVVAIALGWLKPNDNAAAIPNIMNITKQDNYIKRASVAISGGAGRIQMDSGANDPLVKTRLTSNFTRLSQKSTVQGERQIIGLTLESGNRWWAGNVYNELFVGFSRSIPFEVTIDTGASTIRGDFTNVQLHKLSTKSGASNIEYRLGDEQSITEVAIDVGMSSYTLYVPKSSGVSLRLDAGMSNRDLSGLLEKNPGYFESSNYGSAKHTINIRGNLGMSRFSLNYY